MLPSGARVLNEISRPASIELKAAEFIDHAGRFLTEIRTDGKAHFMAIIDKAEGCTEVAHLSCDNGPEIPTTVDQLILEAHKHIPLPRLYIPANKNLEIVK